MGSVINIALGTPNHVVLVADWPGSFWYNPDQAMKLAARIEQAAMQARHGSVPPVEGDYGLEN